VRVPSIRAKAFVKAQNSRAVFSHAVLSELVEKRSSVNHTAGGRQIEVGHLGLQPIALLVLRPPVHASEGTLRQVAGQLGERACHAFKANVVPKPQNDLMPFDTS